MHIHLSFMHLTLSKSCYNNVKNVINFGEDFKNMG